MKLDYNDQVHIERIMLDRVKFHSQGHLEMDFMAGVSIDSRLDYMARHLVLHMQAEVIGQKLESVKYPANWKEAFKQRWFPKWLLKKYPVKYEWIKVTALYPQLHLPRDEHRPVFHVARMNPWEDRE